MNKRNERSLLIVAVHIDKSYSRNSINGYGCNCYVTAALTVH